MKRFGDVLRILSSILLGSLVRDIDDIIRNLNTYFSADGQVSRLHTAEVAAWILVAVFVRNIHGSARFDDWLESHRLTTRLERNTSGRVSAFIFAIVGLFFGPFFAGHELAKHLDATNSKYEICAVLGFSLFVFAAWDVFLWLCEPDGTPETDSTLSKIISVWFRIDMLAGGLICVLLVLWLIARVANVPIHREYTVFVFVIVAAWVVIADYWLNRSFYFPAQNDPAPDNGLRSPEEFAST